MVSSIRFYHEYQKLETFNRKNKPQRVIITITTDTLIHTSVEIIVSFRL
ncbi:hypothetical protein QW060_09745 [Myroides ceti]|uniref:Uncharacterized protein n=1 Tax=Paenimyroides ceti TaxID=395087 RepID=A0ABT8CTE6_9FLAO|nr:hypothetical protein [Paenimyroides ceti]MDN3707411.1 hypothetical protein [Paenimyroides ceti]